ncbi:MAG: Do family serine endopeptidase [Polyangiaceae bacterium]|nr:Do family serine endopeptidase [Polyangiaceae bacterium]
MRRPSSRSVPGLVLVFSLGSVGGACARTQPGAPVAVAATTPSTPAPTPVPVLPHPVLDRVGGGAAGSIADIAERVTPSVVSVSATKLVHMQGFPPGFGFPFGLFPDFQGGERREPGLGSGVVVAPGIVVTNHHVVADAEDLRVTARDGHEFDVKLVGSDEKSDLAVLRIEGDSSALRPLPMGNSSALRLGDVVLAIGNPFGVGQTVTMGIVSAKGRSDLGINAYEDFIQTDAAINPGNSGGALVNMAGELIGINTAILSRSGGNQGIGFAIPADMARPIVESLLSTGKVSRGWLGIGIQDVDADLAAALELSEKKGVLVSDVAPGTPAAAAGLRRGDVILSVDGKDVDSTGKLRNLVASAGADHSVKLVLVREGRRIEVTVKLGTLKEKPSAAGAPGEKPAGKAPDGLTVEPLSDLSRRRFEIPANVTTGVVVTGIQRGSVAAEAGIRPGDVIIEVDRQPVPTVERFVAVWRAGKARKIVVVSRGGTTRFVVVGK